MSKLITIKSNREFQNVYRKGKYAVSKSLTVYMLPNNLDFNRIGITASKNYGKSVKRNRIRRLIRESYRAIHENLKTGYDFVIVARKRNENDEPNFHKIYRELRYLFKTLDVLDRK
ncbi:ribonuclease P protein component [Thermoclostridium stercorarium subsp. thermolacticum DSM 2910]|uniref:Ribonuclease P protein component n=2 Tax=Thermoclostridium stercorarium TaxID=1510 RepID=A0A1B1YP75_THEST|nr:ribonuclease P protein component [Thermoclostridium stercorarium]ANW99934.1 ribonuclease P protein component [Thermoclostridium stercorarium subsp. thermolacticum DSM 2910]ANX02573.1 ribonuclease P protein component [Thermoclostridium stercorarium subsp. leptospartum DSM 9219]